MDLSTALSTSIEKFIGWVESFVQHLPEIVIAIILVAIFAFVARYARKLTRNLIGRVTDHGPLKSLAGTAAYLAALGLGVFMALSVLQLDTAVTSLLAGVGILGLALGFAFQDIAENFIAGVLISIRRPFTDGDLIETNGHFGKVEGLDLRAIHLRSLDGPLVRIPNGDVYGNALTNYSQAEHRRVDVDCGVAYDTDLDRAAQVAKEAVAAVDGRDEARDPEVFWTEFGGSSINFVARFWLETTGQADYLAAKSAGIVRIKKAFDEAGIGIPFPIMTLDFSDAGTRTLDEPLRAWSGGGGGSEPGASGGSE